MQQWADTAFDRAVQKYRRAAAIAARQDIIPYQGMAEAWAGPPNGTDSWWTNGFWPGLMWQLYHATGEEAFAAEARRVQARLLGVMRDFLPLDHDVGFLYLLSTGAEAKLTGSERAMADTLHAATILAGRFNPAGFIRAWNSPERTGWAIIDTMMNLPLLYWAQRKTGDPRFAAIARVHADTTIRHFIRPDGSSNHIVIFDAETGAFVSAPGGQGYGEGSSWSRGQAWALYGITLSHMATGDARYLQTARRVADFFIGHIRADGLTDCDFAQPPGEERLDNIAGAIAACGLLELAPITGNAAYRDAAVRLLKGIDAHTADWGGDNVGILQKCTASYHDDGAGRHINIVYGDYFFVEALAKLRGDDPMLWMA